MAGLKIATIAITEANAGSDISGIETTAARTSRGWRISGSKTWITSAEVADVFLVAARTPEVSTEPRIDVFLVEREREGLSVGKKIDKLGTRGCGAAEVFLDNVEVPLENRLGEAGSGMDSLRTTKRASS